jgi:restriction system protein
MRDLIIQMADDLGLSQEERAVQIPSGGTTIIASRVHWAKTYLKQAGLIEQPKRGIVQITPRGRAALANDPPKIDNALLEQFPEFQSFLSRTKGDKEPIKKPQGTSDAPAMPVVEPSATPEEQITEASKTLNEALRDALLARILEGSPAFFEN